MNCVVVENTPRYRSVATSNEKSKSSPISNTGDSRLEEKQKTASIQHECHSPNLPSTALKLYGRSKEQSILLDAYHRSRKQSSKWNLVIIKGASGTGKTSLVIDTLREELYKTNGTMLRWTSDRQTVVQISPGFNMAMHNWVQDIVTSDESFVQRYQEHLRNSLDSHLISILLRRWPLLKPLFPLEPPTNHLNAHKDEEYRYWKFCPIFMRIAATINFPLVYFLDDFQWMEQSSFRWILDILSGPPHQGACFVIAYNPNEVELTERSSPQRKIEELKSKENINIIEMSIDNLDEASMGDWLTDCFETDLKNTETIRNILYSQTRGNPLFIKEVIQDLNSNSCHALDKTYELSWIIQNREITQDDGYECVCDYLSTRFLTYSTKILEALYYAACLGYRFQEKHLSHVLSDTALPHIQNAVKLGILTPETVGTIHQKCQCNKDNENLENHTNYRFVHNSMHQAVLNLIGSTEEIQYIHFTIARKLLETFDESELQNDLLFVMSHVMKGSHCIPREEMNQYAYLALEAARKAVLLASFDSAKRSIDFAVHMLCEQSWDDNYPTTFSIYHAAAEISYAGGDFDYVETMIHTILKHAHPEDRIQAYCTKIYMMGSSTNQQSEAIKMGLQILQHLGEHFPNVPKRKHVLLSLMRTKHMLRGKSTEMLLRLAIMVEGHQERLLMNLLNILIPSAVIVKPYLAPLLVLRMIQISLQKGLSPVSCVAFAFYGVILAGGNSPVASLTEGARMGDLSLKMLDRFQSKSYVPRVYAAVYGFLHRRMHPTHLPLEQLLCGYRVALETGDIEFAMVNISVYLYNLFESSFPLKNIELEYHIYVNTLSSKHSISTVLMQFPLLDTVRSLMYSEPDLVTSQRPQIYECVRFGMPLRIMLAVIYGEYRNVLKLAESIPHGRNPYGLYDFVSFNFYLGIANVALLQQNGKSHRSMLISARHNLKAMQQVCKDSTHATLVKISLLKAELSSLSPRRHHDNIIEHYRKAISMANTNHCLFEEAFSNERLARYLSSEGNVHSTLYYLRISCTLYREWNAFHKSDLLQSEIDTLASRCT